MPYTLERKLAIMKSRAKHKDAVADYNRRWIKNKRHNSWEYISKIFLKILIKEHEQLHK